MKRWLKILIALLGIVLVVAGILWWIRFYELGKGQLAVIGLSVSDPDLGYGIYLFDPIHRSWRELPTDDLFPWYLAWSPDGKKIAFTYSMDSTRDFNPLVGIAILNLENMETKKVYISPSDEFLNVVTWSLDGQSLIFDVYKKGAKNSALIAFQSLDTEAGKLHSIPFPQNIQPQYFGINHLEVAQNNDYVIGGSNGLYIAPPNLEKLDQITKSIDGFSLTPDRTEITTLCAPSSLCNYSVDTKNITKKYYSNFSDYGVIAAGNWSYNQKAMIYLAESGEGDPQYIMLLDTLSHMNFPIYKHQSVDIGPIYVWRLAWYSVK